MAPTKKESLALEPDDYYSPRLKVKAILTKNRIPDSANQNNQVSSAPNNGTTSVAVIIPITIQSPAIVPTVQAKAAIIKPPFYIITVFYFSS
jgi:hypothetical protein